MYLLIVLWGAVTPVIIMSSVVVAYRRGLSQGGKRHSLIASSLIQDLALKAKDPRVRVSLEKAAGIALRSPSRNVRHTKHPTELDE